MGVGIQFHVFVFCFFLTNDTLTVGKKNVGVPEQISQL